MRLIKAANTPKVFIGALVLFVVLDGVLFYRYQLEKRDALNTLPSTTAAAFVPTNPGADGESEQEEPQREETNQESGTSDDERKDGSDPRENTPEESSSTAKESPPRTALEQSAPSGGTGDAPPPPVTAPPTASVPPLTLEGQPPATREPFAGPPTGEGPAVAEGLLPATEQVPPVAEEVPPTAAESPTPTTGDLLPAN